MLEPGHCPSLQYFGILDVSLMSKQIEFLQVSHLLFLNFSFLTCKITVSGKEKSGKYKGPNAEENVESGQKFYFAETERKRRKMTGNTKEPEEKGPYTLCEGDSNFILRTWKTINRF